MCLHLFTGRHQCKIVWLLTIFGLTHQGFLDKIIEDCDKVLSLNASNCKALYRKSKALSNLGRYREAYDAVAKCSLAVPQVWDLYFRSFVYIMTILLISCGYMASKELNFPTSHQPVSVGTKLLIKQMFWQNMLQVTVTVLSGV